MGNNKNVKKKMKMDENRIANLNSPVVKPSTVSATKLQISESESDSDSSDDECDFDLTGNGYNKSSSGYIFVVSPSPFL